MSDTVKADKMTCVYCSKVKQWPAAFPSIIAAVCWQCTWERHVAAEHPLSWAQRRAIRRAARRAAQWNLVKQARSEGAAALIAAAATETGGIP